MLSPTPRRYELLATKLTNWENHRTEYDYDAAKTSKYFVFQVSTRILGRRTAPFSTFPCS